MFELLISLYTDGSSIGNPGPGGWAAIIVENGHETIVKGGCIDTTNNRMEILAVIEGLSALEASAEVTVFTDSKYVMNTMTLGWKRKANMDLWPRLDEEVQKRRVVWNWVRGHSGDPLNEKADTLAYQEAQLLVSTIGGSLTHIDKSGTATMVDVGGKPDTVRMAVANGRVVMKPETLRAIKSVDVKKGDVLGVARIAGVMAAKNTSQLIPLCHQLPLTQITVEFDLDESGSAVDITATAKTTAKTGVEMEAMTAVSVAALTIYDMCKSADRGMSLENIRLTEKRGGKSGDVVLKGPE